MLRSARLGFLATALFLVGCQGPGSPGGEGGGGDTAPVVPVEDANAKAVVAGQQAFAADLYQRLRGGEGNLLFSPYSIHAALSVVRDGARGETAKELDGALRLPAQGARDGWRVLHASVRGDGKATLKVGNRLWIDDRFQIVREFAAGIEATHGASVVRRNLAEKGAVAREINAWVDEATDGMIPQATSPSGVPDAASLMLVNAIYFHGKWMDPFDEAATRTEPFTTPDGTRVNVPLMSLRAFFRHATHAGVQSLALPYRGGGTEFVVLLPSEPDGLAQLEASVTAERLAAWSTGGHEREVNLFLPRFRFENRHDLMPTLAALGLRMTDPAHLDLSGVGTDPRGPLFLSDAEHIALIELDEEGTKAAAATVIGYSCSPTPPQPIDFRCDRPFLFLIRHVPTGAILFLGRVASPPRG